MGRARFNSRFEEEKTNNGKDLAVDDSFQINTDINVPKAITVLVMFLVMFIGPVALYNSDPSSIGLFQRSNPNVANYSSNIIDTNEENTSSTRYYIPNANSTNNNANGQVLGTSTSSTGSLLSSSNAMMGAAFLIVGGATLVGASFAYLKIES